MPTLPNEIINLILAQLPPRDLIFINKYYNNYKYFRLKQKNLKVSPVRALRRFKNLQINLITHSKYNYFKNMYMPEDEQYVFSVSNTPRNKKRHTIPPEIFKNLQFATLYICNEMLDNNAFLYINHEYNIIEHNKSYYTQEKYPHESHLRLITCNRFYDWSGFV